MEENNGNHEWFSKSLRQNKVVPSPIFSAPGFLMEMIMVDVLHCLDLGVSQSLLGMVFYCCWYSPLSKEPNQQRKTLELWSIMKNYYKQMQPPTRINTLTVEMIKQPGKSPRFRGKGAETRHLVPFAVELTTAMAKAAGGTSVYYNQMNDMCKHLLSFYWTFGIQPYDAKSAAKHARNFCLLFSEFSKKSDDPQHWKIKPKMHMFIHLAENQCFESGDPSRFWCYKDEEFVGIIAKYSASRGGKRIASTIPSNVMASYRGLA